MKIRRIKQKIFTKSSQPNNQDQLTTKDLQLEQMKLQRQLMQTQRMKQRLESEEKREQSRRIMQLQKMEQRRDIEEDKQRLKSKKLENDSSDKNNTSLYKSKSHPIAPVSMK